MAIVITDDDTRRLLSMAECIDAMRIAFRDLGEGSAGRRILSNPDAQNWTVITLYDLATAEPIAAAPPVTPDLIRGPCDRGGRAIASTGMHRRMVPGSGAGVTSESAAMVRVGASDAAIPFMDSVLLRWEPGAGGAIARRFEAEGALVHGEKSALVSGRTGAFKGKRG